MRNTSTQLVCGSLAAAAAFAVAGRAQAAIDGTLSAADGYGLVATQTNVTASPSSEGGGPAGPGNEVAANNTAPLDQLSNAYASITGSTLNLFLGGSLGAEGNVGGGSTDANYFIALQTEAGGVSNLNGIFGGNFANIAFDSGFKPNFVIQVNTSVVGNTHQNPGTMTITSTQATNPLIISETDLTAANNATSAVTAALNNSLQTTAVGAAGDVGFAAASTGLELSIDLSTLGYTAGSNVLASTFFDIGSDTRTTNQVLNPFTYPTNEGSGGYDYTYVDSSEAGSLGTTGRQFTGVDFAGNQFFSIPAVTAAVPEPASLGLLAVGGVTLLSRRGRKA